MLRLAACMLGAGLVWGENDVAVCPGEGARYGDHKCNHDPTHRVCAQLLGADGQPQNWGKGNFWEITGQTAFQWDDKIREENGDSWCICMWATASLIQAAGCENVHIHCDSTDVAYVLAKYNDGGTDLSPAHACLQQKCKSTAGTAMQQKVEAVAPVVAPMAASQAGLAAAAPAACLAALVSVGGLLCRRAAQREGEEAAVEVGFTEVE